MRLLLPLVTLAACRPADHACGERYVEVDGVCVQDLPEDSDAGGYDCADGVPYQGGWPCNPDKDGLDGPALGEVTRETGERFARLRGYDQHGDLVDLYDLAGHGKLVFVDLSAIWNHLSWHWVGWLSGQGELAGYEAVRDAVNAGEIFWVDVVIEDVEGTEPELDDVQAWAATFPNDRVVTLAGNAAVADAYLDVYPTLYLLDADLRIVTWSSGSDTAPLDAALAR